LTPQKRPRKIKGGPKGKNRKKWGGPFLQGAQQVGRVLIGGNLFIKEKVGNQRKGPIEKGRGKKGQRGNFGGDDSKFLDRGVVGSSQGRGNIAEAVEGVDTGEKKEKSREVKVEGEVLGGGVWGGES